jgi:hypothetical protein
VGSRCLLTLIPGNFVGPLAFKQEDAPRYAPGFIVVVVTSIAAALLILVYRAVCVWDNKKRDKAGIAEGFDNAFDDDLTDLKVSSRAKEFSAFQLVSCADTNCFQNPQFRYIL